MRLIGYQTYVRLHRTRRALIDLPPSGDAGDAMVGYALGGIAVALAMLACAGLL